MYIWGLTICVNSQCLISSIIFLFGFSLHTWKTNIILHNHQINLSYALFGNVKLLEGVGAAGYGRANDHASQKLHKEQGGLPLNSFILGMQFRGSSMDWSTLLVLELQLQPSVALWLWMIFNLPPFSSNICNVGVYKN